MHLIVLASAFVIVKTALCCQKYCLQETRLTIFIDLDDFKIPWVEREIMLTLAFLKTVVKNVLRDACYKARLFNQLNKKFVDLGDNSAVDSTLETVFQSSKYIANDQIKKFVDEYQPLEQSIINKKEIVLYFREQLNQYYSKEEQSWTKLEKLSEFKNTYVIIACWLHTHDFISRRNNVLLPEAEWLTPHRLVFISATTKDNHDYRQTDELPICFKSLYDLVKNPNFNRFDYNNIIQAKPEFLTSSKNMTIVFVSNIDPPINRFDMSTESEVSEDIDALIQLMTLLNHKIRDVKGIDFKVYSNGGDQKSGLHQLYGKLGLKVVKSNFNEPLVIEGNAVYIVAYRTSEAYELQFQHEPLISIISDEEWLKRPIQGDKAKYLMVEVHDILTDKFIRALLKEVYDSV